MIGSTLNGGTSFPLPAPGDGPLSVAFSPDGTLLATANEDSDDVSLFVVDGCSGDGDGNDGTDGNTGGDGTDGTDGSTGAAAAPVATMLSLLACLFADNS